MCIISIDSLKFVIKELSGQPNPAGWGEGGVGYYQMGYIMCRFIGMVFKQLSLGMDIEIREQLLDREGFGKFSLVSRSSKIQLNQKYRLGVPVSQRHITTPRKFLKNRPLPPPPAGNPERVDEMSTAGTVH